MNLLIISDLHISGPEDPLYHSLLTLLNSRASSGDIVILAGDLFDLFVGNKDIYKTRYTGFIEALKEAGKRGVFLHYIEGNHDFLIQNVFKKIPGLTLHEREVTLEAGGKKFFVAHGDLANSGDYSYRTLRAFFRSPVMKALVFLTPGALLDKIGRASSHKSGKSRPRLLSDLPLGKMEKLRTIYRSYAAERLAEGYDFVVMGHCHDLDEMLFNIGGRQGQYVNVGFPPTHGSFLSWSPGDEKIQREKLPG